MSNSRRDDPAIAQRVLAAGTLSLETTMLRLRRLRDELPRRDTAPREAFAADLGSLALESTPVSKPAPGRDTAGGYDPYDRVKRR